MKKTINALLVGAVIIPVVLLFWPFARWNDAMSLILRVIPSLAVQILLFRVGKWNIVKALPILLTGAFAAWGTYLYFTSPHWSNATFWGSLIADYVSPFISCFLALIACLLNKEKEVRQFQFIVIIMSIIAVIALALGIDMKLKETTAVETIGGADGPTAIFLAGKLGDGFIIGVIITVIVLICVSIVIYKRFMKK